MKSLAQRRCVFVLLALTAPAQAVSADWNPFSEPERFELRPNPGPEPLPPGPPPADWLTPVLAGLTGLAIGVAAWWVLKSRRRPALLPPHERALRELALLRNGAATDSPSAWIAARVSDILRSYLDERFELNALELTTQEFLAALHTEDRLRDRPKDRLCDFLRRAEVIKFAPIAPSESEMVALVELGESIVQETAGQQAAIDVPTEEE